MPHAPTRTPSKDAAPSDGRFGPRARVRGCEAGTDAPLVGGHAQPRHPSGQCPSTLQRRLGWRDRRTRQRPQALPTVARLCPAPGLGGWVSSDQWTGDARLGRRGGRPPRRTRAAKPQRPELGIRRPHRSHRIGRQRPIEPVGRSARATRRVVGLCSSRRRLADHRCRNHMDGDGQRTTRVHWRDRHRLPPDRPQPVVDRHRRRRLRRHPLHRHLDQRRRRRLLDRHRPGLGSFHGTDPVPHSGALRPSRHPLGCLESGHLPQRGWR